MSIDFFLLETVLRKYNLRGLQCEIGLGVVRVFFEKYFILRKMTFGVGSGEWSCVNFGLV